MYGPALRKPPPGLALVTLRSANGTCTVWLLSHQPRLVEGVGVVGATRKYSSTPLTNPVLPAVARQSPRCTDCPCRTISVAGARCMYSAELPSSWRTST